MTQDSNQSGLPIFVLLLVSVKVVNPLSYSLFDPSHSAYYSIMQCLLQLQNCYDRCLHV